MMKSVRRSVALLSATVATGALLVACSPDDDVITINVYGPSSLPSFDEIAERCTEEADGRYRIVGSLLPADADGQREQLARRLVSGDTNIDVVGLDVTWTAEFAEAGWVLPLTEEQTAEVEEDTLEPTLETGRWDGELYGIPMHTNVQLLWYRESLTPEPPETWEEMLDMAEELEAQGEESHTLGVTAARYEGYVVTFNTLLNAYGGSLLNEEGTEPVVDDNTIEALDMLSRIGNSPAAMSGLSNAMEPEVYAEMQSGRAAFIVNWPYVYNSMRGEAEGNEAIREVFDDLRYATLPAAEAGEVGTGTLGGRNLAISAHSPHPEETYEAIMCMRDRESQLLTATVSGEPPVMASLYEEPEFQEAYPMHEELLEQLENSVPRPQTPLYQNVSTILSDTLSPPSSITGESSADVLREEIQRALDGRGILP